MGAALLAVAKGYEVFVSDSGRIGSRYKKMLKSKGIPFEEGFHTLEKIKNADLVIKSPGIADSVLVVQAIKENKIPVIDELEFAFRNTKGKIIAITGTNGKTTTTLLTYHLMKEAGMDAGIAGNIGQSFARQLVENDHEYWVLEVSNFQLESIDQFKPYIGIMLNITPDHLNRYGGEINEYITAKFRLLRNMDAQDNFIYNAEDQVIQARLENEPVKTRVIRVSTDQPLQEGAFLRNGNLFIIRGDTKVRIPQRKSTLQGRHNLQNTLCAISAAVICGVKEDQIGNSLQTFKPPMHRMEYITSIGTVRFYNDSKATNLDAVYYALESFKEPIVWIAGGVDKGNDYDMIRDLVGRKVKALVCLGKDNTRLVEAFTDTVKYIVESEDIKEVARLAYEYCENNDVVLLSPGCASFDLFENFEDRGEQFKKAVLALKKETEKIRKN